MSRDNKLSFYATDADRSRIEREAEQAGMTVSTYVMSVFRDRWTNEDSEEVARQARVEERVERMTSEATDEMAAMIERQEQRTEQLADMAARSAVYSIANFELLKLTQKPPEAARTKSLQIGARRLRDPFDPDADANADLAIEDANGRSETETANETEAETETETENGDEDEFTSSIDAEFFEKHS